MLRKWKHRKWEKNCIKKSFGVCHSPSAIRHTLKLLMMMLQIIFWSSFFIIRKLKILNYKCIRLMGKERRRHREIKSGVTVVVLHVYMASSTHYNFSTSFHSIFAIEYFLIGKCTTQHTAGWDGISFQDI